jgi:hypothetical protein
MPNVGWAQVNIDLYPDLGLQGLKPTDLPL